MVSNAHAESIKKRIFKFLTFLDNLSLQTSEASFTLVHVIEYDTSTGGQALTYTQVNVERWGNTMNALLDNWAQGAAVALQTAGGTITGTIASIGADFISLSNATINDIAVTVANVRISDILAAGLVSTT